MPSSMIPLTLTPDSSQIHGYGYDAATEVLAVEYQSNHEQRTYHYLDVEPVKIQALEAAPSKGSFILRHIKPHHEFESMDKVREAIAAAEQEEQARA